MACVAIAAKDFPDWFGPITIVSGFSTSFPEAMGPNVVEDYVHRSPMCLTVVLPTSEHLTMEPSFPTTG